MRKRVDELERRIRELEEQLYRRDGGHRGSANNGHEHSGHRDQWSDRGRDRHHSSNEHHRGWNDHQSQHVDFSHGGSYRDHRGEMYGDYGNSHRSHSEMGRGHRGHREESYSDRFPDLSFDENMNQYGGPERGPAVGFDEKRLVDLLINLVEERLEIVLKRNGIIADADGDTVADEIVDDSEQIDGEEEI